MEIEKKKIALVTGGTRGIGKSITEVLSDSGFKVYATYTKNEDEAKKILTNENIEILKFDASNYDDTKSNIDSILQKEGKIDVLVNNAGITIDKFLHKMDVADWIKVLNVNLNSAFNCIHCCIKNMREQLFGRIINISSVNALQGQMGQTNYSASKAGLIGLSKSLALENANKNITVNVVAPGYIETDMTKNIDQKVMDNHILPKIPKKRLGKAKEIANLVKYLVGDDASFITGETLSINGGQYMK